METSTIIFIVTLIIAFIFLRWLITPIPRSLPSEFNPNRVNERSGEEAAAVAASSGANSASAATGGTHSRRSRREVTDSMVEVVQAIAPQLTPGQIRYDLQRSGSVEATIERFMETGTLPVPPGEAPVAPANDSHGHSAPVKNVNTNLIDKYNLKNKISDDNEQPEESKTGTWGSSTEERENILSKRREEMILKARKRLASQLSNEI